jgi:hypothetical protein
VASQTGLNPKELFKQAVQVFGCNPHTLIGDTSRAAGYLADSFRFLQAVLLREAEFRKKFYRPLSQE